MKKLIYTSATVAILCTTACTGGAKTSGAGTDSGSHGSSGPADTTQGAGSMGTSATSTGGSDTSHIKDTSAKPNP